MTDIKLLGYKKRPKAMVLLYTDVPLDNVFCKDIAITGNRSMILVSLMHFPLYENKEYAMDVCNST